jgi:hypothetical protein
MNNKQKPMPAGKDVNDIIKKLKGPYNYKDTAKRLEQATNKTYKIINKKTAN